MKPGVALLLCALAASCGGNPPAEPAEPAVTADPVNPATAATITGVIRLEGTPPPNAPINMSNDPYCLGQGPASTEDHLVGTGGALQNVFVYVKDGLGALRFPVPATPVVLDQQRCRYVPHVLGIQVGQTLEIRNADPTLHNMHAIPERNQEFNKALGQQGLNHTHVFSTAEVMVPFKCDVHRWMNAHVGVLDHPYFAVTGADGAFRLTGLPPGTYTIEAWHEKLGTRIQTVTVGNSGTADLSFTFTI